MTKNCFGVGAFYFDRPGRDVPITECHRSLNVTDHRMSLKPLEMMTAPKRRQNEFRHMLHYVKNDADFESEVRLT